jgi:TRAP-type C4-dicarboxylate transport system permease small subunit
MLSATTTPKRRVMSIEWLLIILALWLVVGVLSASVFGRYIGGARKPKAQRGKAE